MITAAVYILSYDEDPRRSEPAAEGKIRDFQELAAPSPYHDEAMNQWLYYKLHAPLQQLLWQEGQTVYLAMPQEFETADYALACRVVSRASAHGRRPYRELIAVYVDRDRLDKEGVAIENAFAAIDWDGLFRARNGSVDLDPRPAADDAYGQALKEELSYAPEPKAVSRFWSNLAKPSLLYWVLSGLPPAVRTRARVITGVDPRWDLSSLGEFDVQVFAAEVKTEHDPGNEVYERNQKSAQARFLHDHVPDSLYQLRETETFVDELDLDVTEAELQPISDLQPLRSRLKTAQRKLREAQDRFEPEFRTARRDKRLSQETEWKVKRTWETWANPVAGKLKNLETAISRLRAAAPSGPTTADIQTLRAEFEAQLKGTEQRLSGKIEVLQNQVDAQSRQIEGFKKQNDALAKQIDRKAVKEARAPAPEPPEGDPGLFSRLWASKSARNGLYLAVLAVCVAGGVAAYLRYAKPRGTADSGKPAGEGNSTLEVRADPSLRKPFEDIAKKFEDSHPDVKVNLAFEAKVGKDEKVDVFAGVTEPDPQGHPRNFAGLELDAASRKPFATNTLVVVGASEIKNLDKLPSIAAAPFTGGYVSKALVAGGKEYGGDWLQTVKGKILKPADSKDLSMAWAWEMASKKAQGGIVYKTDALGGKREPHPVPPAWYPPIVYQAAVLKTSKQGDLGREFIQTLVSKDGKATLDQYGFGAPSP